MKYPFGKLHSWFFDKDRLLPAGTVEMPRVIARLAHSVLRAHTMTVFASFLCACRW